MICGVRSEDGQCCLESKWSVYWSVLGEASISGFGDPTGDKLEIIGPQCDLCDYSWQIRHTLKLDVERSHLGWKHVYTVWFQIQAKIRSQDAN